MGSGRSYGARATSPPLLYFDSRGGARRPKRRASRGWYLRGVRAMTAALISLLLSLAAFELHAWFPRILKALIEVAVRRLPKCQRARFREEWEAHIAEVPGAIMRLWHVAGFMFASGRMFPRWTAAVKRKRAYRRGMILSGASTRALDVFIAGFALLFLAPLLSLTSLALLLDGGPAMFRQTRIGRGGKLFYIYKFRTMRVASAEKSPISPIGAFLRRTAIDELPQLINVLRGDMSLVGPRPHRLILEDESGRRIDVRPGHVHIEVKRGQWSERPGLVPLDLKDTDAASPEPHRVGATIRAYFRAIAQSFMVVLLSRD